MTEQSDEDIISSLSGTALRVFVYSVKKGKNIGIRETQRDLGLKTASHAQYHLQRLEQLKLIGRAKNNKYFLEKKYENLRSLKVGILTEIYVFRGWLVPSLGIFAGFLGMSAVILAIFYTLITPLAALVFGVIIFSIAALYSGWRAYQIIQSFSQEEE
ncbi:MAG: hypothetical protein H7641_01145 [Candidatus Heimdallarchaeota archaeon]|nr:hypothetical protein [Candidatus Heimdallarchaeota archaeon]MCK4876173.1 hypothetical protein [Candidatus Heimdallarchaeota archaeon]